MRTSAFVILLLLAIAACGNNAAENRRGSENDSAEAELLDQRITFDQVLQRFRDNDAGRVSRTIVQLLPMAERKEFRRLLVAVWERDRGSFPDLNWNLLEDRRVRISLARVLGKWQPGDSRYREYVSAVVDQTESSNDKVEALMALGSFGRVDDIERLKLIAVGQDELLATGALAGLIASNDKTAIQAVEHIAADTALPEQRRRLARQLLGIPRPPAQ